MKFIIGRAPDCHLVLNHASVSSRHASLEREGTGTARLRDEGSSNGTFLNGPAHEIKEAELRDDDVVYFSEEYAVPSSLLLRKFTAWEQSGGQARAVLALGQVHRFSVETITVGSDPASLVPLPYLEVWPRHAVITRIPGGYRWQDLGGGCVVDGQPLRGGTAELRPHARVELGGVTLSLSFDPAGSVITIGAERRGFYLTAHKVTHTILQAGGTRALLESVGFSALPGEFIGLLGPSGSGKTTLLTCLSGLQRHPGVYYNGEALTTVGSACANVIGYVPQDDLLYPELTVRETLYFSARGRLNAHTTSARIATKIDEVCRMLGLLDERSGIDLRETRIGSPERKTLSGGQKKRVNLALELLTDPLILFLDEPTSGLSSQDTTLVMQSLRRLADEKGLPIVITIHQPSLRVYQLLDHTLFLKAGRLVWFGPAYPDSVRFFHEGDHPAAGADEIMQAVDETGAEELQQRYARSRYAQKFVTGRETLLGALLKGGELARPKPVAPLSWPRQLALLLHRQLLRRGRDFTALALQIGQAPLLGLLIGAAFHQARINSPLFLLSFIAIWLGTNATARELVSERSLFQREKRGGVSPAATLLAKLASHGLMLAVQGTLLFFSAHAILGFDGAPALDLLTLWLSGMGGAALGFVISALAKTEIAATAATPLVLVPLILFGGYLAPYDDMPAPIKALSQIMPTRWSYQALVEAEKLAHEESPEKPEKVSAVEFQYGGAMSDEERWARLRRCLGMLAAGQVLCAGVAWQRLKAV